MGQTHLRGSPRETGLVLSVCERYQAQPAAGRWADRWEQVTCVKCAGWAVVKGWARLVGRSLSLPYQADEWAGPEAVPEEPPCPNDPDGLHHVGCGCDR